MGHASTREIRRSKEKDLTDIAFENVQTSSFVQMSTIPSRSPAVESGLSQVPKISWIPNSNEQANPRSTSEGFSRPSSQGPLRHSSGSTPCAQESDGIPEAYGNFGKRSSQRLENIEAVQRSEQSVKHDSTTLTSRIAQVPQGQGVSRLSPQKHGHRVSGLSSQDYGQGGPALPSQGRGKGVSSEGLGFRPQGRGQGLPSQGRGQVDAEPSSPLLDFFSSPESQPLQGSLSSRMTKFLNPPIGHPREPLRGKSGEYDLGHDKALHQKHSYDSFASKHVSENDRMTIPQGHGRGSLKMPSQARGQGNQQVRSQRYPARRQGQEGEGYPTNRPSFQSRSPGHLSSHRFAQPGNENVKDKPFQRNSDCGKNNWCLVRRFVYRKRRFNDFCFLFIKSQKIHEQSEWRVSCIVRLQCLRNVTSRPVMVLQEGILVPCIVIRCRFLRLGVFMFIL